MRLFKKLRKKRRISSIPSNASKPFLLPLERKKKLISEYDFTFKVVVFGAPGVGKATLLTNYAEKVLDTVPEKNIYYIIKKEVIDLLTKRKIVEDIFKIKEIILKDYKDTIEKTKIYPYSEDQKRFGFELMIDSGCGWFPFIFNDEGTKIVCNRSISTEGAKNIKNTHITSIKIIDLFKNYSFYVEIYDEGYRTHKDQSGYKQTIGEEFFKKVIKINKKKIMLQLWQLDSQGRFKYLIEQYIRGSNCAIFMYDIANAESLEVLSEFVHIIREMSRDTPILLVGNKVDTENEREISKEEGIAFTKNNELFSFIEISAKKGQNCEKVFEILTKNLI